MAWIFDTYSMNKGHSVLGVVTGKPLSIGGSLGREEATARGALYVITDALEEEDKGLDGLRVAVQGFGNVGRHLARMLAEEGAIVVAVSDSSGGLHAPKGLDMPSVLAHKAEHGTLAGFAGADAITNDELLALECDVLAPCALEQVIHADNAGQVKARIVCEGANGPVTPAADEILEDRGVLVLPDVLANAGGVVVSYFEWVQGLQEYFWKEEEVNARLNDIVTRAFRETSETRPLTRRACAWPPTGSRCGASPRRPSRGASIPRVVVYTPRVATSANACSRWWTRCVRATSSASTSAAIPSSRLPTARRSRRGDRRRARVHFFVEPEALRRRLKAC